MRNGKLVVIALIGVAVCGLFTPTASAKEISVDINGGAEYTKIQDAINAASTGDTIVVKSGTYKEHLEIDKQVTLKGEEYPVVDGEGTGTVIWILADGVRIEGLKIMRCDPARENMKEGITVNVNNCIIKNCIISENNIGLGVEGEENVITNCEFNDNRIGLVVCDGDQNKVKNNHFMKGGLVLDNAKNNLITGNLIELDPTPGVCIYNKANNNIFVNNTIRSNWVAFEIIESVWGPTSHNNKIYHNNIVDNGEEYLEFQAYDDGDNQWDNGAEGNYWSDYEGEDANGDGIGDTPYDKIGDPVGDYEAIEKSGAKDNYPLMKPWSGAEPEEDGTVNAKITDWKVEGGIFNPGDAVTALVTIENTGSAGHTFYIGFSVYDPKGDYVEGAYDAPFTSIHLNPGESSTGDLTWTVPSGAMSGYWDATVAVWEGEEDGKLYGEYDRKTGEDVFRVKVPEEVDKYALIIGINDYPEGVEDLSYSVSSAEAIYNLLTVGYGFPADQNYVRILRDSSANLELVKSEISRFRGGERIDENDIFVFYFAGHGLQEEGVESISLYNKNVTDRFLNGWFNYFNGATLILIFDSCYSGGLALETDLPPNPVGISGDKRAVLMASKADQICRQIGINIDKGVFTHYLYSAFVSKRNEANINADPRVSVEEAFNYAKPKVEFFNLFFRDKQNPQMMDHYATAENPDEECYFSQDQINPTFITAEAGCPVHLHAYDSEGRHTGLNSAGDGIEENIPGSYYSGPEYDPEEIIILGNSSNITYKIEALGVGEFNFTVTQSTEAETTTATYLNIPISETTEATVEVKQENAEHTMEIDENGDGTADYTKEPNAIEIIEAAPSPTPEEKGKGTPGFEAVFAIAGLLAAAHLLRRRI